MGRTHRSSALAKVLLTVGGFWERKKIIFLQGYGLQYADHARVGGPTPRSIQSAQIGLDRFIFRETEQEVEGIRRVNLVGVKGEMGVEYVQNIVYVILK